MKALVETLVQMQQIRHGLSGPSHAEHFFSIHYDLDSDCARWKPSASETALFYFFLILPPTIFSLIFHCLLNLPIGYFEFVSFNMFKRNILFVVFKVLLPLITAIFFLFNWAPVFIIINLFMSWLIITLFRIHQCCLLFLV